MISQELINISQSVHSIHHIDCSTESSLHTFTVSFIYSHEKWLPHNYDGQRRINRDLMFQMGLFNSCIIFEKHRSIVLSSMVCTCGGRERTTRNCRFNTLYWHYDIVLPCLQCSGSDCEVDEVPTPRFFVSQSQAIMCTVLMYTTPPLCLERSYWWYACAIHYWSHQ